MIKNPSFPLTLSTFLTISYLYYDLCFVFVFLLIFGHFGTSRDTKKRCTGPIFLPLGGSWARFGAVLGNSWRSLGPKMLPRVPKSFPRGSQTSPKGSPDPPKPPKLSPRYSQRAQKSNPKDYQNRIWKITFNLVRNALFFYILGSTISEVFASTIL